MEALAGELDALNKQLLQLQTQLLDMPRSERKAAKGKEKRPILALTCETPRRTRRGTGSE